MMDKYVLLQGGGVGGWVGCVISTYSSNHNGFWLCQGEGRELNVSKLNHPSLVLVLK